MIFLTFDTSLDKTYLTLCDGEKKLESQIIETHDDKYHSAYLIQNLVTLLKKHNFTMQNIKAIGVNIGPGSFTGIRACLTIARVIAQQLEIPLIGISSMEILAQINKEKQLSLDNFITSIENNNNLDKNQSNKAKIKILLNIKSRLTYRLLFLFVTKN